MIKSFRINEKIKADVSNFSKDPSEFKFTPELVELEKRGNYHILFSPLLVNLHMVPEDLYKDIKNKKINRENFKEFLENYLIVPKNWDKYPNLENRKVQFLTFIVTGDCNLRCKYCYTHGGEKKVNMDFETIKKFIDYIISKKRFHRKVRFYFKGGGEPTLAISLIDKAKDYIKSEMTQENIEPKFRVVTNAVFSKKVADWLVNNMDEIMVSFDGLPDIQNFNRPLKNGKGSYGILEENVKYLIKNNKDVTINCVITRDSVSKMKEMVNHMKSMGIRKVQVGTVEKIGRCLEFRVIEPPADELFIENFARAKEIGDEFGIQLNTYVANYKPRCTTCNTGNAFTVTLYGKIVNCPELEVEEIEKEIMPFAKKKIVGKYDKRNKKIFIDLKKERLLLERNIYSMKDCQECFIKWICAGGCLLSSFRKHKDIMKPDEFCDLRKKIVANDFLLITEKYFTKIKPYIEINKNSISFRMVFNNFKINFSNNNEIKGSSFIQINDYINLNKITNSIIREHKRNFPKITLFLLSLNFRHDHLNEKTGNGIIKFLEKLKKNNIYFKVTKPPPRCIFGARYSDMIKKFNIPTSCSDCLEYYVVKDNNLMFCDKNQDLLKNFNTRDEIIEQKLPKMKTDEKCLRCLYRIRNQCMGLCNNKNEVLFGKSVKRT